MKRIKRSGLLPYVFGISLATSVFAQDALTDDEDDDIYLLSPFEVTQNEDVGYLATNTLAGTRIRTQLKDVGSAVSVITKEFLDDTGATDNKSLLVYTTNTEVGGSLGNYTGASIGTYAEENSFASPNSNTRVRGLSAADNTRNYFLTSTPWDGYNVSRVDLQRGPNSILFGLGSPSGIINNTLTSADFYDSKEVKVAADEYGTFRIEGNINQVILEDELAVHLSLLDEHQKYKQKEAYEDDQRFYVAAKYKPSFLQTESISTIISANYENGDITRNSPRTVTPIDCITAWFASSEDGAYGLDKQTFDPYEINDSDPESNAGQTSPSYSDGTANPNYLPALGNFAQLYGEALAIFDTDSSMPSVIMDTEAGQYYGISSDGEIDGTIGGLSYGRLASVATYSTYASNAELEYYDMGQYKDYHLTDSTIFDFYNHILDGDNKKEWQDFENYNVTLNQTFFNNKLGYELSYDYQDYEQGQQSLISASRYAIYVDVNETLTDGSDNPNVGRAFVSDNLTWGNNNTVESRETTKAQFFGEFDFRERFGESWFTKILGRHMLSGTVSKYTYESEDRSWYRYYTDDSYRDYIEDPSYDSSAVNFVYYLGDSLLDADTASGAYLPTISNTLDVSGSSIYMFDSTWSATGVDPSAWWDANEDGVVDEGETQSENPDNYVGWTEMPFTISEVTDETRDSVTYSANKERRTIDSKGLVYQAYLFSEGLIGTFGWRKDETEYWAVTANKDSTNIAILDDSYSYDSDDATYLTSEGETTSWSLVAHVNTLLGKYDFLPFNLSLYYSESENFDPGTNRVDLRGDAIEDPSGNTVDKSIAISTKDNRYTFKLTKFKTTMLNDTASGLSTWFIGCSECWAGEWCNIFEYDLGGYTMDTAGEGDSGRYDYAAAVGESEADAAARETAAVSAWRAHQERMREEFPTFYETWLSVDPSNVVDLNYSTPAGFAITQDTVSEGYEFEFIANPTDNWRISINASKTEATRSNVGGEAFIKWMDLMMDDLTNTAAGDLRIWYGSAGQITIYEYFMQYLGGNWNLVQLKDGTAVDELRKWHVNLITNYTFTEGMLKGFNVGAGYRWMDKNIIGYPLMTDDDGDTTYDLSSPYYGPSLDYFDFWVGYKCALTDKVDWKIQVNIKNAFTGNELIPLSTQPDGTPAAWYIGARRKISVTNTFTF